MTKVQRRLAELQRLRDEGTISDDELTHARQRVIDAATAAPEGRGFRFTLKFALGVIGTVVLGMVVFGACTALFVRSTGSESSTPACLSEGTSTPCESPATVIVPLQQP
jgi:cytochrome c-type biogenesis protein CcmH/NrfG